MTQFEDLPVILLGGSSFIGLTTAQTLYYFYNFYCTYYQSQAPNYNPEFIWSRMNFADQRTFPSLLNNLIKKSNAKVLVNFVHITNHQLSSANEIFNSTLIDLCNKHEIFLIFISSDQVFSGNNGPYSENSTPSPLKTNVYGIQKYELEQLYVRNASYYAILRLSTVLGINFHFQKLNLYAKLLYKMKNKITINGATNIFRTPSHVFNVPFLLNKIIENYFDGKIPLKSIFHLPGSYLSEFELYKSIIKSLGGDDTLIRPYRHKQIITNEIPLNLGLNSRLTTDSLSGRYLTLEEGLLNLKRDVDSVSL